MTVHITRLTLSAAGLLLALLVAGGVFPVAAQAGICDAAPPARLAIGGWAAVTAAVNNTPAAALRLRAEPRTTGAEVVTLPAGTVVQVLEGPACNDGFQWWRLAVPATGAQGWSAEGLADAYYLAPAAAPAPTAAFATNTPPPTAAAPTAAPGVENVDAACPGETALSYLRVGSAARAADQGHPVRLRAEPDAESLFLQMVYQDQAISVIGGPTCAAERRWWQVQVAGRTGWTVEATGGRYLLIDPANPPPAIDYASPLLEAVPAAPPLSVAPPEVTPIPTPRPLTPPAVVKRAAYTPDGALLAVGDGAGIRLYDTAGYALRNTLGSGPVIDFVTIGGMLHAVTWAADGLRVVDATTGALRTALPNAPYDPAWAAAAPDGAWLVLGPTSDGATATLWSLTTAAPPVTAPYWWPGWGVVRAAFSPDGRYVLINDVFALRSCETDGAGCRFDLIRNDFLSAGLFGDVSWSANGQWMAGFSDRFWLWNGDALGLGFTLRSTLDGQDPRQVALSPDGTRGALISRRLMEVWSLAEGNYSAARVIQLPADAHSLEFRPDGAQFVVAAGASVIVYEPVDGGVLQAVE